MFYELIRVGKSVARTSGALEMQDFQEIGHHNFFRAGFFVFLASMALESKDFS